MAPIILFLAGYGISSSFREFVSASGWLFQVRRVAESLSERA
jgi:hypothetical protein